MSDTSVKWFTSAAEGAPVLSGTAGSLITMLDALLVSGFGTKAVDTAVVANGVCRLNFSSGVSAAQAHAVISVSGFVGAGAVLNKEQRTTAVATNYIEFPCELPDGTLPGSISFKMAPLGWEKVFSKTNVAVYRSTDPAGTRAYYRIDDTNAVHARVQIYESMTDVDTGFAAAPTTPAGGFYWLKRDTAGANGVYWLFAGDSRLFYPMIACYTGTTPKVPSGYGTKGCWAGDINSYRSGDAWSAGLAGGNNTNYADLTGCIFSSASTAGTLLQRQSHGIGGAVPCGRSVTGNASTASGNDGWLGTFPSRSDNGLRLSQIMLSDGVMSVSGPRGELPGAYHCPQTGLSAVYPAGAGLVDGTGAFSSKKFLPVPVGSLNTIAPGVGFVDVTGPWR